MGKRKPSSRGDSKSTTRSLVFGPDFLTRHAAKWRTVFESTDVQEAIRAFHVATTVENEKLSALHLPVDAGPGIPDLERLAAMCEIPEDELIGMTWGDISRRVVAWADRERAKAAYRQDAERTEADPRVDPKYAALLEWADKSLATKQRRVLELLCEHDGRYPLADMAADEIISWGHPWDNSWNSMRRELNAKLRKHNWRVHRQSSRAVLNPHPN